MRLPQSSDEPVAGGSASISMVSSMSKSGSPVVDAGGKYVGLEDVVGSQLGRSLVVDSTVDSPTSIVVNSAFNTLQ